MTDTALRFEYPGPQGSDGRDEPGRKHFYLFKTERAVSEIQVFDEGVKNRMHHHLSEDGVWIVLAGHATFYGEGGDSGEDRVMGELDQFQGLLIPAGTRYWFESTGDEPLQILRVDYQVGAEAARAAAFRNHSNFEVHDSYGTKRWNGTAEA